MASFDTRRQWLETLFPQGIPRLWCPPLTHFSAPRTLATDRIGVHLRHIARHTQGWLVPGSTGEGWQMGDDEVRQLLNLTLSVAQQVDARVLVGVLREDAKSAVDCIEETTRWLCQRSGTSDVVQAMLDQHVCGFTVCPPTGAELSSEVLQHGLQTVLRLNLPTALYQLPQVTQNEMSPELVAELAAEYPNFFLFKDTSGQDRVALSGVDLQDVFCVRGAEGDYAKWLTGAGGPYHGYLLSTANVFADRYAAMIELLERGEFDRARQIVAPVEQLVPEVFQRVAELPWGNPFTNANKAMDCFLAFGADAGDDAAPLLHDGEVLPTHILRDTRELLKEAGLLPPKGYLSLA